MNWKHGYFAEGGYTYGFYAETMPLWLQWASLIQGHRVKSQEFRYLDAGCGQGFNLILAAAAHPDSEFVGIDFMPEHIAHGRTLAKKCGLTNVQFYEADFIELANNSQELGSFDYAVCHGITTWIAPAVKSALFQMIGQVLNPGGIFYNSYNTLPGWLGAVPFQHLVLLLQEHQTGVAALQNATNIMERLQSISGLLHNSLPSLSARMKSLKGLDPDYLVQEYNNQYWQPVFIRQMMRDLNQNKLTYLGTASLSEAFSQVLPAEQQELLQQQISTEAVEQLRDYLVNQSFRRDLYVKGRQKPWDQLYRDLIGKTRFVANPLMDRPAEEADYQFKCGSLSLKGDKLAYDKLLNSLAAHEQGMTILELSQATSQENRAGLAMMISMLMTSGWIFTQQDHKINNGMQINHVLALSAIDGAPYRFMSLPGIGGAISASHLDWLMIDLHIRKVDKREWSTELSAALAGKSLVHGGQPVTDESQRKAMLEQSIGAFQKKLPLMHRSGALN